jgi:hypothetical protein
VRFLWRKKEVSDATLTREKEREENKKNIIPMFNEKRDGE